MVSVHDVTAYILSKTGPISAMKLQKLVYYCQAWSLVWDDKPLFEERIEAWVNGPVVRELYERHKGVFQVSKWDGDPSKIDSDGIETINVVLDYYAKQNAQWLSDLSHQETPWQSARVGMSLDEIGDNEITAESMMEYYSSLGADA